MRSQHSPQTAQTLVWTLQRQSLSHLPTRSQKRKDIMANAGHNRSIIADFHRAAIAIDWL